MTGYTSEQIARMKMEALEAADTAYDARQAEKPSLNRKARRKQKSIDRKKARL